MQNVQNVRLHWVFTAVVNGYSRAVWRRRRLKKKEYFVHVNAAAVSSGVCFFLFHSFRSSSLIHRKLSTHASRCVCSSSVLSNKHSVVASPSRPSAELWCDNTLSVCVLFCRKMLGHWKTESWLFSAFTFPSCVCVLLTPNSIQTEDKSLITAFRSHYFSLVVSAEWETSAYRTNEWTRSNVSEKTHKSTEKPTVSEPGKFAFITRKNQKWTKKKREKRMWDCFYWGEMNGDFSWAKGSSCGDELVEAYYHRTVVWYNLSLSINPWLCPWFKFTICYKNF